MVLAAFCLALVASSILTPPAPIKIIRNDPAPRISDYRLYQKIADSVGNGENYYQAAAREQRVSKYPLKPFFTMRMPVLATIAGNLGRNGTSIAIWSLIILTLGLWLAFLREQKISGQSQIILVAAVACSILSFSLSSVSYFHECWAALCIMLSLSLNGMRKIALSIAFGLLATLFRELAAPFLVLMACAACWDRKWKEAAGWGAALLLLGTALAVHAHFVAQVVRPEDLSSQGWNGMGGWGLFISSMTAVTPLALSPDWLARLLIPLCLFGWLSWRTTTGLRVAGLLLGYAVMIMMFARPDTFYWGLLITPLLLAGIVPGIATVRRLIGQTWTRTA